MAERIAIAPAPSRAPKSLPFLSLSLFGRARHPCRASSLRLSSLSPADRDGPPYLALRSILLLAAIALGSIGCASIAPPRGVEPVVRKMEVTAYCACSDCCGWRRTWYGRPVQSAGPNRGKPKQVGMTASGAKARKGTIAADTTRYPFGTIMRIEGYGFGRVEDRGGAIKGDHIDLFFPSHHAALLWGRRRLPVRIWFMPSLRGELLDLESLMAAMEESTEDTPATAD